MKRNELVYKAVASYFHHYKKMPKFDWLCAKTKLSAYQVRVELKKLADRGIIKRKYNQYSASEKGLNSYSEEVRPPKAKCVIESSVRPPYKSQDNLTPKTSLGWLLIVIVLFAVSIGASYMSWYYSNLFFLNFLNRALSFVSALVWVLFSVFSFQAAFWFRRNQAKPVFYILISLWCVVVLFSMFCTVVGQYNLRMVRVRQVESAINGSVESSSYARLQWEGLESKEEDLEKSIESKMREKEIYIEQLGVVEPGTQQYLDAQWLKIVRDREIQRLKEELSKVRDDKEIFLSERGQDLVSKESSVTGNAFDWIGGIFSVENVGAIEFWISLFPAIFYDLIAPLSLFVVLFMRRRFKE